MKKTLVSALTTALVVGAASTTFAAANPFSDVPADHWAYDAVAQLAADGVIDGYGDTTFRGDRSITRYEMAQMVARAMAKSDVNEATKAMIDKLAAEFADELNNLGVRVANLERNADMVKWNGKIEYTYESTRMGKDHYTSKENTDKELFRLEPSAEVNDHWHVNARLDATNHMNTDTGYATVGGNGNGSSDYEVKLKHIYAQGDYKNFTVRLGKMELADNMAGQAGNLILDSKYSGAEVEFGSKVRAKIFAGRTNGDNDGGLFLGGRNNSMFDAGFNDREVNDSLFGSNSARDDAAANIQGLEVQYNGNKLEGGVSYYHLGSSAFKGADSFWVNGRYYSQSKFVPYRNGSNNSSDANIWGLNLGYHFDKNSYLHGSFAQNTKADHQKSSWQIAYEYKGAKAADKGSWGAWLGYRKLGYYTSLLATTDDFEPGFQGWHIGANYTILKNIVLTARYSQGDSIDGNIDYKKLFGRVEFFF